MDPSFSIVLIKYSLSFSVGLRMVRADNRRKRRSTTEDTASGNSQCGRAGCPPATPQDGSDAISGARQPEAQERADGCGARGEDDAWTASGLRLRYQCAG